MEAGQPTLSYKTSAMATTALSASVPRAEPNFRLTKAYLLAAFAHLAETEDLAYRAAFFSRYVVPDVRWAITGGAHSLVGTRRGIADHHKATFERLGKFLFSPVVPRNGPVSVRCG